MMERIPVEIYHRIFDLLHYDDILSCANTCKRIYKIYSRYMFPNPVRDVWVSENDIIRRNPFLYNFSSLRIAKRTGQPRYVTFENLPCHACIIRHPSLDSYSCDRRMPCNHCERCRNIYCCKIQARFTKQVQPRRKFFYQCFSPYNRSEHLICIRRQDVGKERCDRCRRMMFCQMSLIFNGCQIPGCSFSSVNLNMEVLSYSLSHFHKLCKSCYFTFPRTLDVQFSRPIIWREQ